MTTLILDTLPPEDTLLNELKLLIRYLNPVDIEEFKEGSLLNKTFMIISVGSCGGVCLKVRRHYRFHACFCSN